MKHSNDGGVLKGAHEYKKGPDGTMGYHEVPVNHTEYPKVVGSKVYKDAEAEKADQKEE